MRKLRGYILFVVFLVLLIAALFKITKRLITNYLLKNGGEHAKAIIINEKNYLPNRPVKAEFTYSYLFIINGRRYTNDAHDINLNIGDTVEVEFVRDWPTFNRPLHAKD